MALLRFSSDVLHRAGWRGAVINGKCVFVSPDGKAVIPADSEGGYLENIEQTETQALYRASGLDALEP
jgi:hypothetical protein